MGNNAKSNGPSFSPTSLNAGQRGAVSSSSPSHTVLYPVSPAKYSFFASRAASPSSALAGAGRTSSTAHDAQSVRQRSNGLR